MFYIISNLIYITADQEKSINELSEECKILKVKVEINCKHVY